MTDSPTMYSVSVVVEVTDGNWTRTVLVPTFYLMADVQGILSEEHAESIAREMFLRIDPRSTVHASACATSMAAHS